MLGLAISCGSKLATIHLSGCFRIETADGHHVPMVSAKGQGLIALLAVSPYGERSRQWLQAKLWSDRSPEQASGSLRQELAQIRNLLEKAGIGLTADRHRVALDLQTVKILRGGPGEFLEGLDVRDSEFDLWLVAERMRDEGDDRAPGAAPHRTIPPQPWTIWIALSQASQGLSGWIERLFSDTVARTLRELFQVPVQIGSPDNSSGQVSVIEVQCFDAAPGAIDLRVTLSHPTPRHQIWSGHLVFDPDQGRAIHRTDTLGLINELIGGFDDVLRLQGTGEPSDDPDRLCRAGIAAMFTMQRHKLIEADALFARAFDLAPRGTYLAWRAQLKTIQKVERHSDDIAALKEEGRFLAARALELEPNNSVVLAALSNTHGQLLAEHDRSRFLAERSVLLNPANPMAWWALSSSNVYTRHLDNAYQCAATGRKLSLLSPHRFWWDNQLFASSLVLGRLDEALHFCKLAHAENPSFRPPLRYLIGLHAHQGRLDDAMDAADRLKAIEPDFEIARLTQDGDYPASLLHRAPGLDVRTINALI